MRAAVIAMILLIVPAEYAFAGAINTQKQASDRVLADGFSLVSKTEPAPGSWDVWASKDGIAYEVKLDANTGSVIKEVPLEDDD